MTSQTAILFFARTPDAEAKAKHWSKSRLRNIKLAKALHDHTTAVLAKSALPVVISDEHLQKGKNFHEKITHALADFFAAGYEHAIVVGSDCANLSITDIEKARQNFKTGTYTYGASPDGGVYLFTLSRSDFSENKFRKLPWCTSKLSLALLESIYANAENSVEELTKKLDIDANLAMVCPLLYGVPKRIVRIILSILSFCKTIVICFLYTTKNQFVVLHNKGSPLSLS